MALTSFPRSPFFNFIRKRSGPFPGEVTLDRNRVYILPNRTGVLFGVLLILLLVGSVNYEKSLGYALTFLLAAIANAGILTTWKNLKGLVVKGAGSAPVFCGDNARFAVRLYNPNEEPRHSIVISHADVEYDVGDVPGNGHATLGFEMPSEHRGLLSPGPCKISTEFPFGLFVAWTWVDLDMQGLVYPAPAEQLPAIETVGDQTGEGDHSGQGQEVFEGLRSYQQGDSYKRVSWKAYARNQELMIKQYSGGEPVEEWIDWDRIEAHGTEARLSILCRLLLDADASGHDYGLRMPENEIAPDRGNAHRHQCLRALALYGLETA